jgi:glutaredoxin
MEIEFLYFDGCPYHKTAFKHLNEVLKEEKIEAKVERINVKSNEEAKKLRFLGSPSVRINGKDIDKNAQKLRDYGMKCRVYLTEEGILGYPPKEMIRKAILDAKQHLEKA